jgi:hypothetical protein
MKTVLSWANPKNITWLWKMYAWFNQHRGFQSWDTQIDPVLVRASDPSFEFETQVIQRSNDRSSEEGQG